MSIRSLPARSAGRWPRHSLRIISAVALAMIPLHGTSVSPAAAADADGIELDVTVGIGGVVDPGDQFVVTATVSSANAFDGQVEVNSDFGIRSIEPLELAGGTTKVVRLVHQIQAFTGTDLTVVVRSGSDVVAERRFSLRQEQRTEFVGAFPGIAPDAKKLPERLSLPGERGVARFGIVDGDLLDLGFAALGQFDDIAATSGDLAALTDNQRLTLLAWLAGGGRLLLDDTENLAAIPTEWQPPAGGYRWAGRGEVRDVGGKARNGAWTEIIEPSALSTADRAFFGGFEEPPTRGLGDRGGFKLPSLRPLLIVLGAYALLAGPLTYLVLRRLGKLTLTWMALPTLAVVLTVAVALFGGSWNSSRRAASNVVREGFPGGSIAATSTLLSSTSGGNTSVDLPAGFSGTRLALSFGNGTPAEQRHTADRTRLSTGLDPGQATTIEAIGRSAPVPLEVTARVGASRAGQVSGVVRNTGTAPIESVAVFAGGSAVLVGRLEAGAEKPYTIEGARAGAISAAAARRVWRNERTGQGNALQGDTPLVDFGLWQQTAALDPIPTGPIGLAQAVGWVAGDAPEIATSRTAADLMLLSAVAQITADRATPALAVQTTITSSPFGASSDGTGQLAFRYLLPPESTSTQWRLLGAAGIARATAEVWLDGKWVELTTNGNTTAIPAGAAADGTIEIRVKQGEQFSFGPDSVLPTVEGAP